MIGEIIATVKSITGKAYARSVDGEMRALSAGSTLREGDTVVTPDGGIVELALFDGSPLTVNDAELAMTRDLVAEVAPGADESAVADETVQQVLSALESGEDLAEALPPTAAGQEGAAVIDGEGHSWIRLSRIEEFVVEFEGIAGTEVSVPTAVVDENLIPVDAVDDASTTEIDTPVVIEVLPNDQFQLGAVVIGVTDGANGSVVINGDNSVTYTPKPGFFGTDVFTYTAVSADGNGQDSANVTVVIPAPPPAVQLPSIRINDDIVVEGDTATLTISLSKPWGTPVTVQYRTADDTALAPGDYDPVTGLVTITFEPGETSRDITFQTNGDAFQEGIEQFLVVLANSTSATIADGTGVVEIIDGFTAPPPAEPPPAEPPPAEPPPAEPPPPPPPDFTPSLQGSDVVVDEDDLSAGSDTSKEPTTQGNSFTVTSPDGVDSLTVGGNAFITGGVFTASSFVTGLGNTLSINTYNPVSGEVGYTYTLDANADHPAGAGENSLFEEFEVVLSDPDGDSATSYLRAEIVDDIPSLPAAQNIQLSPIDTNLLLILDISGSMDFSSGISGKNRLEAATDAIEAVVDAYEGLGDVKVRLVTFAESAQKVGSAWQDPADVSLPTAAAGFTNFDDALIDAIDAFDDPGKLQGAQNKSYMFSDGNPTNGVPGNGQAGIQQAEEDVWVEFLQVNDVDSYALAMGTSNGLNEDNMDPIAYDGVNGEDRDAVKASFADLEAALLGTVFDDVDGTLYGAGNSVTDVAGADGGQALSIVFGVEQYTYSFADDEWTLPDNSTAVGSDLAVVAQAGTWSVNAVTGAFTFDPGAGFVAGDSAGFTYSLIDEDGDGTASGVNIIAPAGFVAPAPAVNAALDTGANPLGLVDPADADPLAQSTGALLATDCDDVFAFALGAEDATIANFDESGQDALDLRDILVGEDADTADLSAYLDVGFDGSDTVIRVSSSGAFADNPVNATTVDQTITLEGVDLVGGNDSATAIQQMKDAGNLITD
ncbi:MAG: retention module-containing protein [Halioglobus sp.]|nr:retention module-containing protein [Halioglobus sp.]